MITVDGRGNIEYTRGTDETLTVNLFEMPGRTPYTMRTGERLTLTVTRYDGVNPASGSVIQSSSTTNVISITRAQTLTLEPGRYAYDIQLRRGSSSNYTYKTVVGGDKSGPLDFYIVEDITHNG